MLSHQQTDLQFIEVLDPATTHISTRHCYLNPNGFKMKPLFTVIALDPIESLFFGIVGLLAKISLAALGVVVLSVLLISSSLPSGPLPFPSSIVVDADGESMVTEEGNTVSDADGEIVDAEVGNTVPEAEREIVEAEVGNTVSEGDGEIMVIEERNTVSDADGEIVKAAVGNTVSEADGEIMLAEEGKTVSDDDEKVDEDCHADTSGELFVMAELVISVVEVVATPGAIGATVDLAIVEEEFLPSN